MNVQAKVGLFVVLGFLFLLVLSTQLSIVRSFGNKGYEIFVQMKDVLGLNINSKINMSGVIIGEVKAITLNKNIVLVTLFINDGILIPNDSLISLQQKSVLGGKVMSIQAGKSKIYLKPKEFITKYLTFSSFEQTSQNISNVANEFKKLLKSANDILDKENKEKLKGIIDDFYVSMKDIRSLISENRPLINETITKYKILAEKFTITSNKINQWIPNLKAKANRLINEYTKAGVSLNKLISKNSKPLNDVLNSSEDFFSTGKEALVKVDQYLASLTESQLKIALYNHYMTSDKYNKIFASLTYLPEPSTYYILKIASSNDYTRADINGKLIKPALHDKSSRTITAQYGKRFNSILARAGLQESTGGVGFDYFMNKDKLKWTLDIFDFNAQKDLRSNMAHLNFGMTYKLFNHINLYAGVDNILNEQSRNFYMGVGMMFIDNHLKYFVSGVGKP